MKKYTNIYFCTKLISIFFNSCVDQFIIINLGTLSKNNSKKLKAHSSILLKQLLNKKKIMKMIESSSIDVVIIQN